MMYGSRDIKCDRHNFLSSSAIFCPFATPPKNPKNEDIKEMKMPGDTIDVFHFGQLFALLPPPTHSNSPKNENLKKKKKNPGAIIILHKCTKSHD